MQTPKIAIPPQIKQMIRFVRMSQNPQAAMNQLMQNNPQLQQLMQFVNMSGRDPMSLLNTVAAQKGIDMDELMRDAME